VQLALSKRQYVGCIISRRRRRRRGRRRRNSVPRGSSYQSSAPPSLHTLNVDNVTTASEATTDASAAAFASDTVSGSVVVAFEMYVSPLIALVGLVSNVVSVCVLARLERGSVAGGSSKMAQSAHIGLMSLALADFLYCLCVVPELFVKSRGPIFKDRGFDLFYLMYGHCWQNVFLFTSTWLTVSIAIGR
jgi:hypothetical protein